MTRWLFVILALVAVAVHGRELHIAIDGDDENAGTVDAPIRSLAEAVQRVEAMPRVPGEDIEVILGPGTYVQRDPVVIGVKASGTDGCRVVFRAREPGTARLSGLHRIEGWRRSNEQVPFAAPAARGKLWVADIPKGWCFHFLYVDGESLPVSRYFNADSWLEWPHIQRSEKPVGPKGQLIRFPDGVLAALAGKDGMVEMNLMPVPFWNTISVLRGIDPERSTAYRHSKSPTVNHKTGFGNWGNYNLLNDVSFIDRPGEWAVDSVRGRAYLWPQDAAAMASAQISAPRPCRLIAVLGEESGKKVRNVHFRDLVLDGTDRLPEDEWPKHWVKRQAELPDALLFFENVEACSVKGCRVVNSGSYSIAFNQYAQGNKVVGNDLGYSACGGVLLQGYGPGTKDVNKGNRVTRNYIHHTGRGAYLHSAAVTFYQSGGNTVEHNLLYQMPYVGVAVIGAGWKDFNPTVKRGVMGAKDWYDSYGSMEAMYKARRNELPSFDDNPEAFSRAGFKAYLHTRNNVIRRNAVIEYMNVLADGGALYAWGCGTGNRFEENLIKKSELEPGQHLILVLYMDDHVDGTTLRGNVSWAPYKGKVNYTTKGSNVWEANTHAYPEKPAAFDALSALILKDLNAAGGWPEAADTSLCR